MNTEERRIILDLVVLVMLFVACGILGYFLYTVLQDGGKCVYNPLQYYLNVNNLTSVCDACTNQFKIQIPN